MRARAFDPGLPLVCATGLGLAPRGVGHKLRGVGVLLEICVDDPHGVAAAVAGGADRIELCAALELGGLTPSPALLRTAVATGLPVHAMIRSRGGGFVLGEGELALMLEDIGLALAAGAAGVVVGALRPDRTLDCAALAALRAAADGAQIVLHRAIDLTPDPVAATEEACTLGYNHILSSGGAPTALAGSETLARMVDAAAGRLSIIAGSGVRPENAARIVQRTGVRAVHGSASIPAPDAQPLGFGGEARRATDADLVRRLRVAMEESRT